MCDYSLSAIRSRPAKVGDRLVTKNFGTGTIGFASEDDSDAATCVLPGTELAFDEPAALAWQPGGELGTTAIFRQVSKGQANVHHDLLEFANGQKIFLTALKVGQTATVLQLPAAPKNEAEVEEQRRAEYV